MLFGKVLSWSDQGFGEMKFLFENKYCQLVSLLLGLWLLWRWWTFTILPRLYPQRMEYLPYWIPYIGHLIPFFRNSNQLFMHAKKSFSHKPCVIRIAGQDMVVATSASQIAVVEKHRQTFGFEPFVDLMYDEVAKVSPDRKHILWQTEGYKSLLPNPKRLPPAHTGINLLHIQFQTPDLLHQFMSKSLASVDRTLYWNSFYETSVLASTPNLQVVSLESLVRDVLFDSQIDAFFGPRLKELEPDIRIILKDWDWNSWQVSYKLPPFLAKHAIGLRDHLVDVLEQYYSTPLDSRPGSVPFVTELYDDYKKAGLSTRDVAGIVFPILWGLNSNVIAISYWMIAHVLANPQVVSQIREEISPVMQALDRIPGPERDGATLSKITQSLLLDQSSCLNSTFYETLRFTSTGSGFRKASEDTTLEGRHIPRDTIIMIPQRIQMMSTEAFGSDAHEFDCYRFARDKSLLRKGEFRGFGGGVTLCSGRIAGRHQVIAFVAQLLWRYDFEIIGLGQELLGVKGKSFPRLNEALPGLGPGKPVSGDDMILKVTLRRDSD